MSSLAWFGVPLLSRFPFSPTSFREELHQVPLPFVLGREPGDVGRELISSRRRRHQAADPSDQGDQITFPEPDSVGGPVDVHGWISVLRSVGALEAYRKTYQRGVTPANVAAFLILNNQFPASVRHCVGRVEGGLRRISGNTGRGPVNSAEREVGGLHHDLNYLTADEIISRGLHEFLQDVLERCDGIGNAITEIYLRY